MSRRSHHPACPAGAHVHGMGPTVLAFSGWAVCLDADSVVLCLDEHLARRVAELINAHGLADVPDHLPAELVWAAPDPADRVVDWRLEEDPRA